MKKEFLDYLYELRSDVQGQIDDLVEKDKTEPQSQCCDKMELLNETKATITAKRQHIYDLNKSIEKYLSLHHTK